MLGPSGIGLDDIVSSRIGLAAATLCLAIGTGEDDVRSGASRRRRRIRDDDAHGALLVLVLFGKIVWGKSTIRRRPVQRTGALAIFVVLLLVLVTLAVALISSR